MRRRTTSAITPRSSAWVALLVLLGPTTARASDVSDELVVGALSSSVQQGSSPYVSDRLGGAFDASEQVNLSLDGTYTRYFKANRTPAENIFQLALAIDYTPSDHWAFGTDFRASPPSTTVSSTSSGAVRSRTSLLAAGAYAEYDTAGDGPFETVADTYLGLASYSTTQRARSGTKATPPDLNQFRVSPSLTEILWRDTEGQLSASYYAYSVDPLDTGYFGASVFARGSVSEGVPLEPLRWSVRPTLRRRIGRVKLSAFVQYGRYVGDVGSSVLGGLKAQVKVEAEWKLWASFSFQRDVDASGETLSIPWGAIGARVSF